MLEFKTFGEIDLNNTPIVLLGCGHFFTAETLDGHMDMAKVYEMDLEGEFVGLREVSGGSFQSTLRCPDCQCSVQQYATQRYNRVINRTVIDEMSKRFLVSGKARLQELEGKTLALELDADKSRKDLLNLIKGDGMNLKPVQSLGIMRELEDRSKKFNKLAREVASFVNSSTEKDQPVRKLHDATVKALRARESISESMDGLAINGVPMVSRDRRIILGSLVVQIKVHFISLTDRLEIGQKVDTMLNNNVGEENPGSNTVKLATAFFKSCENCMVDCQAENLPKLNVETRLYYSRVARLYQSYVSATKSPSVVQAADHVKRAKKLLNEAQKLCSLGFQNADTMQRAVEQTLRLLGQAWYEPMSADELAIVKAAMVSGRDGLATHSGHWYNCQNGHPVSYDTQSCWDNYHRSADNKWPSLRLASAACPWSRPDALSAVLPSVGNITHRQPV